MNILGPILGVLLCTQAAVAAPDSSAVRPPRDQRWGIGMSMRVSNVPFDTDERTVTTLVPLILFENDRFFLREIEGGVKVWSNEQLGFNLLGRAHYFDIPAEAQNDIQEDTIDWGGQLQVFVQPRLALEFEWLTDANGHASTIGRARYRDEGRRWKLNAQLAARYKTSSYNSYFWGLRLQDLDSGTELGGGAKLYYNLWESLFVAGAASLTWLDAPVRNVDFVVDDWKWEGYLGAGVTDPFARPRTVRMPENGYVRVAHAWATPSSLAQIIRFEAERDPGDHQLSTIFYGHPLTDRLFRLPIDVFLHTGLGWHWKASDQNHEQELVAAIKIYYTIPLPVRLRLGAAEGLSWVTTVPAREEQNLSEKGYNTSQLLNYLDFSADLNLGDITPGDALDKLWIGYYIHHRSAIYKQAQQFGRIRGGSNFQAIYLQHHF